MERNPRNPVESESHEPEHSGSSDKDSTKKKRRRVAGSAVVASTTAESSDSAQQTPEASKPKELSALEQALAQLATETRRQKAETFEHEPTGEAEVDADTEADEEAHNPEATAEHSSEADEEVDSAAQAAETEAYEPLQDYSVGATEFSGGEVIIDLGGSSVEEHVLPLEASEMSIHPEAALTPEAIPEDEVHEAVRADAAQSEQSPAAEALPVDHPGRLEPLPVDLNEVIPHPAVSETPHLSHEASPDPTVETPTPVLRPEPIYMQPQAAETVMAMTPNVTAASPYVRPNQTEQVISKADFDDAIHRATKIGQNRGVAAGLLVGGGYEHFKHKRREKRAAKKHQETAKKLAEARKTLAFTAEQQSKQRAEYTAQAEESNEKLAATERRVNTLEQQLHVQRSPEHHKGAAAANISQAKPRIEQPARPVIEAEPLPVAPEHRLQTSSWHSIEVDARTGRAVEKPVFEYGHEYFREQAQENALGQPPAQDTAEQRAPVTTTDKHTAPAGFGGDTLPPMYSALQTPTQSSPTPAQPKPHSPKRQPTNVPTATKTLAKPTQPAGPIWPLVLALVVVVICLSLALR